MFFNERVETMIRCLTRDITRLRTVCQLDIPIRLVSPNTLRRFEGKAKRVIDLRKLHE